MPIDPEPKWKQAIAGLKPDNTMMWAKNLSDAVDSLVTNKAGVSGVIGSVSFTFNKAIFMAQLMAVTATPVAAVAAQAFGAAWLAAMQASTMVVPPGSSLGSPTPATIWSVVFTSLIDPPSIVAAQASLIAELTVMQAVSNAMDSPMGSAFMKAFKACTVTINGLNSIPPPPAGTGPVPLIAPAMPLM